MSSTYNRPPTIPGSSTASAVNDLASTAQEQVQNLAQEQYDKLEASIRRNPLQAAAIAAGVGFVLALLARR